MTASLLLASCSTPKNVVYFQDVESSTIIDVASQRDIVVKPEDKLSIMVTTQDPVLSQLFNLVVAQNRLGQTTSSVTTIGQTSNNDGRTSYYTVDKEGDINFPVIGKLHVGGLNRFQVAEYIEKRLQDADLVKDPIVTVEFANTGISILGEVAHPGRYEFNKDQLTIIDALAMAGDLKLNGEREDILVVRKDDAGHQQGYRINILDLQQLAQSPVYYLQQDDIIYVKPNDKAQRETTASGNVIYTPSFWVTLGSLGISVATLIVTLSK